MKKIVGINGFGRFGLHLLKYWLDRDKDANFIVMYINDDTLSIDDTLEILKTDESVVFNKYQIKKIGSMLHFRAPDGEVHEIEFTSTVKEEIPWLGRPDIFLECSGKNRGKNDCLDILTGNTNLVFCYKLGC